jgi:hypothetical protein
VGALILICVNCKHDLEIKQIQKISDMDVQYVQSPFTFSEQVIHLPFL